MASCSLVVNLTHWFAPYPKAPTNPHKIKNRSWPEEPLFGQWNKHSVSISVNSGKEREGKERPLVFPLRPQIQLSLSTGNSNASDNKACSTLVPKVLAKFQEH